MMITVNRFLSGLDTAMSALFNADVITFTFIPPPYFSIYILLAYSTFLMSLVLLIHDVDNDRIESLSISLPSFFFYLLFPLTSSLW